MKQCSICKVDKALEEFSLKLGKHTNRCKPCNNEYFKKWYTNNKDKQIARVKNNEKKNKILAYKFLFEYFKNNPCIDCGETNPIVLEFDHVKGIKNENISSLLANGHTIKRLKKEIELCEVRCANCHRIKTAYQFNWWITKYV
jgi:hypothetical protein